MRDGLFNPFFTGDYTSGGGEAEQSWSNAREFTVEESETLQYVVVDKHASMKADYSDLRFCVNPSGTTSQKKFLPYWIDTSDENSAGVWVGFKQAPAAASTFYCVFGNTEAESVTSGYKAFNDAKYYFNDFSRGINYDVVNVLGGYDKLLAGDANGEETWPAGWQNPDDPLHCGVIYKRQDTNLHAGNPTTRTAMKITTDGWETWGDEFVIDDPDSEYNCTSSTSVAIPTTHPTQKTFTVETGLPWVNGDPGQARASDTQYFDFTVESYNSGTGELVVNSTAHVGTGTLSDWIISSRVGATNAVITAVKMPNGTVRLIMLNSHVDYTISNGTIRVGTKYSDDFGTTWSEWEERGPDQWINVGGQAITMQNGTIILGAHQNAGFDSMTEHTLWFYVSRDYGLTYEEHSVQEAGVYIDESGMFQMKDTDTWEWIEDKVRVICRVENSPFHYYTFDLTVGATETTNTTPVENGFYVDEQSRGTYTWCDNRIVGHFGDVREQMVYSDDSGDTWHPIPFTTIEGNTYSSRRVYTISFYLGNGRLPRIWSDNKLSGGANLYINYWDSYNMALRALAQATLTDSRTRPTDLEPGLRINGSLIEGYRTTSTTSMAPPTSHPTERTFTVEPDLDWAPGGGETGVATYRLNSGVRFNFTTVSYNPVTGEMVVNTSSNAGSSTQNNWVIDKISNLLSEQAFVSYFSRNGKTHPFKLQMSVKTTNSGVFGLKKDETRATATVTISDAGNEGDVIEIWGSLSSTYAGLFTGIGKVAEYTVQSGDAIADVVNGLVASANLLGICPVTTSDGTTLTLQAWRGEGANINTKAFTIVATGDVAGSSGNFSGGVATEGATTGSNIIYWDKLNDNVRIEQANDNHSQTFSNTDDVYHDYEMTWDETSVVMTDGTTTKTKTASDGSGIPDWLGHIFIMISTAVGSPWSYFESTEIKTIPAVDTEATAGDDSSGEFTINSLGDGFE